MCSFFSFLRNAIKEREKWLDRPYYKKSCPIYIRR